jgi:hypothetical protein
MKKTIPFWLNDPKILLNNEYISEVYPTTNMQYYQKLNSVTRLIMLISIICYFLTNNIKFIYIGLFSISLICILYLINKQKLTSDTIEGFEGFNKTNSLQNINNDTANISQSEYQYGTPTNPFSNVMISDINEHPNKKPAPPAYDKNISTQITNNIKKAVQEMNPNIKNTNKQLYGDIHEKFNLDMSNRAFFSTANTESIPGDQTELGKFLYGNMPSSHDNTEAGAEQRVKDTSRYILY